MRASARVSLTFVWLFAIGGMAFAQAPSSSGTLQVPHGGSKDQPVKAPAAAPRQPVHKVGEAHPAKTPVVPPRGPLHPQKPAAAAGAGGAGKPGPVVPETPAEPPGDAGAAAATKLADPEKPDSAAAKLPRFASLRSDDVNMRAGPGTRYRIDWVYKRRELPVEIEREFDVWRWVRDADGIQGWVHQATLMGRRSFVVEKADATLRSEANEAAAAVAILKPGVIGRIRSCEAASNWCNVQAGSYRGYLRRDQFWGVLPGEIVAP